MIRAAAPGDAAAIAAIYAPFVAAGTISFEIDAPGAATIARRMAAGDGIYPWLVAEADGVVLAYAYAGEFSARQAYGWTVETTIYVAAAAHGRGIGRRLYGALLATLAAQGFAQAIGRISLPNAPSMRLHAAMGFEQAGILRAVGRKDGRWIDVAYWQRSLTPQEPPAAPQPFAAVGVREP